MEKIPEFLDEIEPGDNTIFRGHADLSWDLKPSIGRHYEGKWSDVLKWELGSLDEFKKRSVPFLKYRPSSDIEWLCLMQHHGCATRLLDFTTNPLIALFFASDPSVKKDGEVIIARYGRRYENVADKDLFDRTHSFAYYPPHITERIIGQSGCFVYSKNPNTPLSGKQITRIAVRAKDKSYFRMELKALGISYSTLFPGLDGICQDMNEKLILDISMEGLF